LNGRGAPAWGLVLCGLIATAMIRMSQSDTLVEGFTFLTTVVTAANLPLYLLCAIAWLVLWRRGVEGARGLPVAAVLGLAFVAFAVYGMGRDAILMGVGLVAFAAVLYVAMRWLDRRVQAPA
jgi:APA family basic amino acid/polyamine antiporter